MAEPVYTTLANFRAYVEDNPTVAAPADDQALTRLLERAEGDLDGILGPLPILANGRKYDPTHASAGAPTLDVVQAAALDRATCAQAEYRLTMGEDFFAKPQHTRSSGPDFTTEGKLPLIGPKVARELAGQGLVVPWAHAATGPPSLIARRVGVKLTY